MHAPFGINKYRLFAALLLSCCIAVPANSQEDDVFDPTAVNSELLEIEADVNSADVDSADLTTARADVIAVLLRAEACRREASVESARLDALLEPLKDIDGDVTGSTFGEYDRISRERDASSQRRDLCLGLSDSAQKLIRLITDKQNEISQQFLSHRDESIFATILALPQRIAALPQELRRTVDLKLVPGITPVLLFWVLVAGGALAAILGVYVRRQFCLRYEAAGGDDAPPDIKFLFPKPLADHAPLLLEGVVLVAILFAALLQPSADLPVIRLAAGVTLYGIGLVIIDWATGPLSPSASVKGLIPDHVKPLRRRLRILLFTLVASFVVLGTRWLAIRAVDPEVAGRATMIFLVAAALLYLLAYLGRIPGLEGRFRLIRYAGALTLVAGIVILLVGFHNFAGYLIHGVTRTALALFLLWVLLWCVLTLFDYLIKQDTPSAHQIRRNLGMTDKATRSGLGFMQLVADLVVWIGFLVFIVYVWDDAGTTLDSLYETLTTGFSFGPDIRLVPIDIITGILVFVAVLIVIGWMKRWIDRRWLQQIVIERGAREALITLFGYVGFVVALLVGLTRAGVDLGGLAIVSGALALGIGFGMQEIANNFVSGLILLFERPIRTGDFITVGETEGFVRRIRIRATEIETLDNQNVLVPNSELISGRVTNWVLRDPAGRLQLQVGVAYGSDVERVREILESVAHEHSEVITDGSAPAPRALFMGFGDSSLDFELRVRIYRIDRRFSVQSDLNFVIDAAFRDEGIAIPFPQRDLHVVSYPAEAPAAEPETGPGGKEPKEDTVTTRILTPADGITRSHTESVELPAAVADAWSAITDIEKMKQWLVTDGEFTSRIGGSFALSMRDGSDMSGRIDIYIPERRLRMVIALREGEDPLPTGPITVTLQLDERDDGCSVSVVVTGIPADEDWEEDYKRSESRWQTALEELKAVLKESA